MKVVKRLGLWVQRHVVWLQPLLLLFFSVVVFTSSAGAVIRFNNRSLFIANSDAGATTTYKISFTYNNLDVPSTTIGSIDMLFCYDPIPSETISVQNPIDHHPCVSPTGLDLSHAVLSAQTGETGFSILSQTANHIILTRAPGVVNETPSSYTFTNVKNPTDTSKSFAARLSDYSSTNATGEIINLGSVVTEVGLGVVLETQVPPQLVFCVAQQVNLNCIGTDDVHFTDMGTLSATQTLVAHSQMGVGTNASGGFAITVNGPSLEAGNHIINPLTAPTVSAPGNSQFGLNLRQNSQPGVGSDPDGDFTNAIVNPDYNTPNLFMYKDGDVVASAPNVSLIRRYTVSYIVNVPPNQRAGVYNTTLTYICSGRF
jgi:hypothetical protein